MTRCSFLACSSLVLGLALTGCGNKEDESKGGSPTKPKVDQGSVSKLEFTDVKPGEGPGAQVGDRLYMGYRGTLKDGTSFDGNMNEKQEMDESKPPFSFVLGTGAVIKGWDEGLLGAKKGSFRKLRIPYEKAYGAEGSAPKIPAKADLFFDVVVLEVVPKDAKNDVVDVKDTKIGSGPEVTEKSTVVMKYKGYHVNGHVFDDQTEKTVTAPVKRLVKGFKDGVIGMKKGGKATITVPPGMIMASSKITYDQIVKFDVEMIDVK
jgi:FKBP-type peptidyl-prolyl cis-trans isomerase